MFEKWRCTSRRISVDVEKRRSKRGYQTLAYVALDVLHLIHPLALGRNRCEAGAQRWWMWSRRQVREADVGLFFFLTWLLRCRVNDRRWRVRTTGRLPLQLCVSSKQENHALPPVVNGKPTLNKWNASRANGSLRFLCNLTVESISFFFVTPALMYTRLDAMDRSDRKIVQVSHKREL